MLSVTNQNVTDCVDQRLRARKACERLQVTRDGIVGWRSWPSA